MSISTLMVLMILYKYQLPLIEIISLKNSTKNGRRVGKARKGKSTSETAFEVNNNDNNWLMNLLYIVVLQFGSVWVLYGLSNMADV